MPGDELAGHEEPDGGPASGPDRASGEPSGDDGASGPAVPRSRPGHWAARYLHGTTGRWLAIFGVSLGLLLIRFLVPTPVGQADNRDGPRLMCGLGLAKVVPPGRPVFFRYAYFEYLTSPGCVGRSPYPSSEIVPLEVARGLTPVFGLPGDLNLIALGVLMCVLTSVAIASLATGLRIKLWAQLLVAAAVWLIIADSAFFDVFASPFSEASALVGLLLVAAGVLYLRRGWRETVFGLVLAGSGGFLAILSKEQYMVLALPICVSLVLATAGRGQWRGLRRFRDREATAGVLVAAGLALDGGRLRAVGLHQPLRPATAPHPGREHDLHGYRDQTVHRAGPAACPRAASALGQVRGSLLLGQDLDPAEPAVLPLRGQADRAEHRPLPPDPSPLHPQRGTVGRDFRAAVPDHPAGRLPDIRRAPQGGLRIPGSRWSPG